MTVRGDVWQGRLLALLGATLAVFGLAAVYGASSIWSLQNGGTGAQFVLRQTIAAAVGAVGFVVAARIDYRRWQSWAWWLLVISTVGLVVLLLPFTHGIAPETNGARRWIRLGPLSAQPSQFATLAAVIWTAMLASKKEGLLRDFRRGVLPFLVILVLIAILISLEPDLSSAALMLLLAGVVVFVAGARIGHFLVLAFLALPIAWHEIVRFQYRVTRILAFLSTGAEEQRDAGWQITQSLIGMGSGQLLGVGFGEGTQKLGYLPQAYSDFIFSTIGEEWGFVGVMVIVGLYAAYVALGFHIARTARDRFGMLLATGLTALVGLTAVLHMAVTLELLPTTGLPLPFISYGGSHLLVSLVGTGILVNIAHRRTRG